ncbi:MAG TPA: HD family hydrolase [Pyrinomonadaceae bacterium]|nr:HD family hydrolase [Pyrinomonadaceae bacterium]
MLTVLVELQRLKRLDRTGWILRGLPSGTESVAAHSFGVSLASMFLVDELAARGLAVDSERVLRMALLHDWAEARTGDMPKTATGYFGVAARRRAEVAAFSDVVKETGSAAPLYRELYEDYENRSSLEARLVKAADVIDLLVQTLALERGGARGLDEFWDVAQHAEFGLEGEAEKIVHATLKALVDMRRTLV